MIVLNKSSTAGIRTCDSTKVTKETLYKSSLQHRSDITKGIAFPKDKLDDASLRHDQDKLSNIDRFHQDFFFRKAKQWRRTALHP